MFTQFLRFLYERRFLLATAEFVGSFESASSSLFEVFWEFLIWLTLAIVSWEALAAAAASARAFFAPLFEVLAFGFF